MKVPRNSEAKVPVLYLDLDSKLADPGLLAGASHRRVTVDSMNHLYLFEILQYRKYFRTECFNLLHNSYYMTRCTLQNVK